MTFFRRFIRWLAQDEITRAHERGYKECAAIAELRKRVAYAEGQVDGRQEMSDAIDRTVAARTMGMGDYINAEDLASTKKGMIH